MYKRDDSKLTDINLDIVNYKFEISHNGVLIIKLIKEKDIIGNINIYVDDNDLMGLMNLIKYYFKNKRD